MDIKTFFKHQKDSFKSLLGGTPSIEKFADGSTFYPYDLTTSTLSMKDKYKLYQENPILNAVINIILQYVAQAKIVVEDINTNKIVDSDPFLDRMENPNGLQGTSEYLKQWALQTLLEGGSATYVVSAGNGYEKIIEKCKALINIPLKDIQVHEDLDARIITDYDGTMERLRGMQANVTVGGSSAPVSMSELILFYDSVSGVSSYSNNKWIKPISRVDALKWQLSNVMKGLEAQNVLANYPGGKGIASARSRDSTQAVPLNPTAVKNLENKLDGAGFSHRQRSIVVSQAPIDYTPTLVPYDNLGLDSINDKSTLSIMRGFGVQKEIFSMDEAKYENKKVGELIILEGTCKSLLTTWSQNMNNQFDYRSRGRRINYTFDHLSAYSIEKEKAAIKLKNLSKALKDAIADGYITVEEAQDIFKGQMNVNYG